MELARHAGKQALIAEELLVFSVLAARDQTSLDLFWLKDDSLADLDNLPEPIDLADEIVDNLMAGIANFRTVAASLRG